MGEEYVASIRGGQSITTRPPVFSANSQHVYCCSGTTVRVYSAKSGRFVRTFRGGHVGLVTGITLNPRNCFQVITSGEDGNVVVWDTEGGVLKTANLGDPIADIALLSTAQRDHVFCLQKKSADKYSLISFDLASLTVSAASASDKKLSHAPKVKHLFDMPEPRQLRLVVNKATSSVISCSRRTIYVWKCNERQLVKLQPQLAVTCVTSHPTLPCIATGCAGGQIKIWYKFTDGHGQAESIQLHWHANAVTDIAFTHDGAYLMSGGEESVLVIWQLSNSGATRNFLPRLGAPLRHIVSSSADEVTAICHVDNVVRMVSGISCTPLFSLGGLLKVAYGDKDSNRLPVGLLAHHSQSALVLNGTAGQLQFYNPFADKPFFDLDIVCGNYIAPSLEKTVPFPSVKFAALSDDGLWLATVEFWERSGFSQEQRLKFWRFSLKSGKFKQVSCIDQSLSSPITSLHFQPRQDQLEEGFESGSNGEEEMDVLEENDPAEKTPTRALCVTSYQDGLFKLWSSVAVDTAHGVKVTWKCWSSTHHRREGINATAFSADGSLVAVAYSRLIVLWDVETGALRTTFVVPHDEAVRLLTFGCQSSSRFLLASTQQYLITWDLIESRIISTVQVSLAVLTADRHSPYVAAVSHSTPAHPHTSAFVFNPAERQVACHVQSICDRPVVGATFVPRPPSTSADADAAKKVKQLASWRRKSELFFISSQQKLYYLRPTSEDEEVFEEQEEESEKPSLLAKFIEEKSETVKTVWPSQESGQRLHTAHTLLSSPAHTLPSMKALCNTFLQSLILPKPSDES